MAREFLHATTGPVTAAQASRDRTLPPVTAGHSPYLVTHDIPIRDIIERLADRVESLCLELLPNGKKDGNEYRVGNVSGTPGQSLGVRLSGDKRGVWHDFETSESGDALDLVKAVKYMTTHEALKWSTIWLGLDNSSRSANAPASADRRRDAREAPDQDQRKRIHVARRIWRAARPAQDSLVETYLRSRGINIKPPQSLRFSYLKHAPSDSTLPCMVAGVQATNGEIVGVHRTYLRKDGGGKAQVAVPRMSLGRVSGCAVRLGLVGTFVAISKGIENALSAMQAMPGLVTWAALSTTGMRAVVLPPQVRKVLILADADPPGEEAAHALADRLVIEGRTVSIAHPANGADFHDVLRR